jgi:hypothetical protein
VGGETLSLAPIGSGTVIGWTTVEALITGKNGTGKWAQTLSDSQATQVTARTGRRVVQMKFWKGIVGLRNIIFL